MTQHNVQFCIYCGASLEQQVVFGETRPVCPACNWIYFEDPKVAVGVVLVQANQVLLTRRIFNPEKGKWSIPTGFMNAHEHPHSAAQRECREETGLDIRVDALLDILSGRAHPRGSDLLLVYRATLLGGSLHAGDDADRAAFFPVDDLPPLAFDFPVRLIQQACNPSAPVIE
jgi:ADP-ribose pyrophosphatase YjhB (NUDIX family)